MFAKRAAWSMKQLAAIVGLWLLLMVVQQGAVVHELGHVAELSGVSGSVATGLSDSNCALCPAYAQAASPAFSHSFFIPSLVRAPLELIAEPLVLAADNPVPAARSRGPPVQA